MQEFDLSELPSIDVWHNVDATVFHNEITPLGEPAVLKDLVGTWPIVEKGRESPESLAAYIRGFGPNVRVLSFIAEHTDSLSIL